MKLRLWRYSPYDCHPAREVAPQAPAGAGAAPDPLLTAFKAQHELCAAAERARVEHPERPVLLVPPMTPEAQMAKAMEQDRAIAAGVLISPSEPPLPAAPTQL